MPIAFRIFGLPVAQGSLRGFVKHGKPIITSTAKGLGAWRNQIAQAAYEKIVSDNMTKGKDVPIIADGGYEVSCIFFLPRPKSLPKRFAHPAKRPDIDKLQRGLLDALTGIIWHDDAQVVKITAAKEYASEKEPPGVAVTVRSLNAGD